MEPGCLGAAVAAPAFVSCRGSTLVVAGARAAYPRSGDPRWRYNHPDGERGRCHGNGGFPCGHCDPPPIPNSRAGLQLRALEAGEPVVVTAWIASGHCWGGGSWSGSRFELPWSDDAKVRITLDGSVFLAE